MQARPGDKILVRGHHVGDPDREAEVLAVEGPNGTPPYQVQWSDGHKGVYFPGSDAQLIPAPDDT